MKIPYITTVSSKTQDGNHEEQVNAEVNNLYELKCVVTRIETTPPAQGAWWNTVIYYEDDTENQK